MAIDHHSPPFPSRRPPDAERPVTSLAETIPLSQTMSEKIEGLRLWARQRARPVVPMHPRATSEPVR